MGESLDLKCMPVLASLGRLDVSPFLWAPPSPFNYRYQPSYDYIRYRAEPGAWERRIRSGRVGGWVVPGLGRGRGRREGGGGGGGGPGQREAEEKVCVASGHESGFCACEELTGRVGGANRNLGNRVFQLDGTARSRTIARCPLWSEG